MMLCETANLIEDSLCERATRGLLPCSLGEGAHAFCSFEILISSQFCRIGITM